MHTFKINGKTVDYADGINLLEILRDKEGIKSAKDGCSEGACGTCMVLVDGRAMRACIMRPSRLEGKEVITIEGMSQREKEVYQYTFAECGAVQCGFCIPGMVISAKGLLDKNNDPTRDEVKRALRGNICRCTGYVKIEEAILLAAKLLRENLPIPEDKNTGKVGENIHRLDAYDKTLGKAHYVDDLEFDNMTYGSALRAKYPRATVLSLRTEKAKAHPDCVAVFTADDIDGQRHISHLTFIKDWPALIAVGEETRYIGDSVALVVSERKESLAEILELIEVEYQELPPVLSPEQGLAEDAPDIHPNGNLLAHEHLVRGDVETALQEAAHVVTYSYSTPFTEHAFLEPEAAIGLPENGGVRVYTSSQGIYDEKEELSLLLGIPEDKVHITSCHVGGAFGGKEDMSVQHHAAFLAYKTGRIVKVQLSRAESIAVHPKRHAAEMVFTSACDSDGILTALKAEIITDTGAYASLGGPVLQRACTHAAGPYNYQNIDIEGKAVYTNNPPAGAFRGFGVTQSCFAVESNLNKLAEKVGISSWEIRHRNAIRPGQVLPNGQIADEGTAMVETLEAVKEDYDNHKYVGIACAMKNAGLGVGVPDIGRCRIFYREDGKFHIYSSAACIGQGIATVMLQMFCEATGFSKDQVEVHLPDTVEAPDSGTTTASRQTAFTGEAVRLAALQIKAELEAGKHLKDLQDREFFAEFEPPTDKMGSDKPNPVSHLSYGYATQLVILNEEGKVEKVVAAHDVGRAINPNAVEGQIEGGVVMGLGYALTEDFPLDNGVPTARFGTLGLFRANESPEIKSIIVEKNVKDGVAFGAKGVGEITTIPTAPAAANAYYVLDGEFRTKLPMENTFYRTSKK